MKKIAQGNFEIFTTKADAIDKFMQMQGVCREEIGGDYPIEFCCTKKGKIRIFCLSSRKASHYISTRLNAKVIEQYGKTYVSYYTTFNQLTNILCSVLIAIDILFVVLGIMVGIASPNEIYYLPLYILSLLILGYKLFANTKERKNSQKDSEILIKELEKRVEAVNLWDK